MSRPIPAGIGPGDGVARPAAGSAEIAAAGPSL